MSKQDWKEFAQERANLNIDGTEIIEKDWMPENAFMLATPPNKKEEL